MKHVAIIGSGIAGAAVAYALQRYGASVTVFEQHGAIASEASGNPAALIMPRLDVGDAPIGQLHRDAFIHAVRLYEFLGAFTARGVADSSYDAAKIAKLIANPPLPADWLEQRGDSLFHHKAGVIEPLPTIIKLLQGSTIRLNETIDDARLAQLRTDYDAVVICGGRLMAQFAPTRALTLDYRLGQIDWEEGTTVPLMGDGYAVPHGESVIFGATHDHWNDPHTVPTPTAEASERNITTLKTLRACHTERSAAKSKHLPFIGGSFATLRMTSKSGSRTALRTTTPRHMPLAGCVEGNIYALGALGSRGFTTAPWLGEFIASQILKIPSPLSVPIQTLISPTRYLTEHLKRAIICR